MITVPLEGLPVIGAMRPLAGAAALAIAQPVYRLPDGRILRTRMFHGADAVNGVVIEEDDWFDLVRCEEACDLPEPVAPGVPVSVWVLRFSGPAGWRCVALGDLRQHDAEVRRLWVEDACVCIVRQDRGDDVRSVLAAQCDAGSMGAMALRDWAAALPWATLAMLAGPAPTPERMGRLIGLLRAVGRTERADGWLVALRRSMGADFAEATLLVADRTCE